MEKHQLEFTPPEAEFTPPEAEFTPTGAEEKTESKWSKRRVRRLAAALMCLTVLTAGVQAGRKSQVLVTEPPTEPPAETPTVVTVAPPETVPATTQPVPAPVPDADAILVQFSSRIEGLLLFSQPQNIRSVTATVWDTCLDRAETEYEIPVTEIQGGTYRLPAFDLGDMYLAHREEYDQAQGFPEAELRLDVEYTHESKEELLQKIFLPQEEQGWGIQYCSQALEANEYVFPGCFVLRTYSAGEKTEIVTDENQPLLPGQLRLTALLDGVPLSPESYQIQLLENESYRTDENGEQVFSGMWYQTVVIIPKPKDLPETGDHIARFTVSQELVNYDYLWVTETEVPY
ncbi:MAG: hypothetical protein ACI4P4_12880 [Faecousia sp.]